MLDKQCGELTSRLYESFKLWAEAAGEPHRSMRKFSLALKLSFAKTPGSPAQKVFECVGCGTLEWMSPRAEPHQNGCPPRAEPHRGGRATNSFGAAEANCDW